MRLSIVDVFAEAPLQGNQLAVVRDIENLSTDTMQAIAREMNFSETTFVTRESSERAAVRIFTPGQELPFAGHPVIGTAWVLARDSGRFILDVPIGSLSVRFDDGMTWMSPPAATLGPRLSAEQAAAIVGLDEADLDAELPAQVVSCGIEFVFIGLRSLDRLRGIRLDTAARKELSGEGATFIVCPGAYSSDADFAARMHFFDGVGIREDPATGSANSAFASYLQELGKTGRVIVEQGFEIKRPSRLYLDIGTEIAVGGKVQLIAEGALDPGGH